ncbi:hypothetical protein G6O67_007921 [Ophiocordyceps sinensis]|uniref:CFEM domain-containing protein n=1 Tax=Ophiocordyceps sinensis TaxID=72228 RepID=A0A8H4LT80_9HYPO|nr:hypothetical protein G6O67_007921 [Ophiocordyceps sinensis]
MTRFPGNTGGIYLALLPSHLPQVSIGALSLVALTHFATASEQCLSLTSRIPTCARSCVQSAAYKVGCDSEDLACRCTKSNYDAIQTSAWSCITDCGFIVAVKALHARKVMCQCVRTATPAAAPAVATLEATTC